MNQRKVSLIVFYNDKKEILLQNRLGIAKRIADRGFFGGKIEDGETPEIAIIRETKEELCFDLIDFKYIGNHKSIVDYHGSDLEVEAFIYISYIKNLDKFILQEGGGMEFFSIENAKKLDMVKNLDNFVLDIVEESLLN
ncbi:MAG: NUDIX hydrolase [Candidatus Gracilibacteria bacterium]|nr:NUDIX hydrolase [Candidatus Gracilibacteria bacterium]